MTDWTDPEQVARQYADTDNFDARVSLHEEYSTNDTGLHEWVFNHLDLPGDADVLGVGSGPGYLWRTNADSIPDGWCVTVTDRSPGMVSSARTHLGSRQWFSFAVTDAGTLPFASDRFDAVVANHMLYHVPERERAFREFARVLRDDGRLYATTNGDAHMRELVELIESATDDRVETASQHFSLGTGRDQLAAIFDSIERHDYPDSLRVTAVEPIVEYALSRPAVSSDDVEALATEAHERMDDGVFAVTKETGLFVASQ
jgi:ubiquinone/menaquinone biosynthesis C-methylase UbiE